MPIDPANFSDEHAQRVLVELFELLPAPARPGYDELESALADLIDDAPAEVAGPLAHLDDSAALRGALARQAIATMHADAVLRPLVDAAVERAGRAHMVALPELIAGVLVVMALMPSHIEKDAKGGFTVQWNQLQNLALLMKPVAEIVKAMPKSLLDKLG